MNKACLALIGLSLTVGWTTAAGAVSPAGAAGTVLRTPLQCQIVSEKVLQITNSTGRAVSAGTQIYYDVVRKPDHAHMPGSFVTSGLAPAAVVRRGLYPSYSCTAWFRKPLVMSP